MIRKLAIVETLDPRGEILNRATRVTITTSVPTKLTVRIAQERQKKQHKTASMANKAKRCMSGDPTRARCATYGET